MMSRENFLSTLTYIHRLLFFCFSFCCCVTMLWHFFIDNEDLHSPVFTFVITYMDRYFPVFTIVVTYRDLHSTIFSIVLTYKSSFYNLHYYCNLKRSSFCSLHYCFNLQRPSFPIIVVTYTDIFPPQPGLALNGPVRRKMAQVE